MGVAARADYLGLLYQAAPSPVPEREQAMALLEEIQRLQACLARLRDELRKLADDKEDT